MAVAEILEAQPVLAAMQYSITTSSYSESECGSNSVNGLGSGCNGLLGSNDVDRSGCGGVIDSDAAMAIFSALLLAIDSARVEAVSSDVGPTADSDGVVALHIFLAHFSFGCVGAGYDRCQAAESESAEHANDSEWNWRCWLSSRSRPGL